MRRHPKANWDVPSRLRSAGAPRWRRKFRCSVCGTVAGRQEVRATLDPADWSVRTGYTADRVELPYFMRRLGDLDDGTASFGTFDRLRSGDRLVPRGKVRRYLAAERSLGDPYMVGRRAPNRSRVATGYWIIALSAADSARPFVLTCPNEECRARFLVDGTTAGLDFSIYQDPRPKSAVLG